MEFLIVYLTCSYDRSAEPACCTRQEIVGVEKAQEILDFNRGKDDREKASKFDIKETKIFTYHHSEKKLFNKIIVMRTK